MHTRNAICCLLALLLIASGRVRRAKNDAFAKGRITAIYFHKPHKRLLHRSLLWLKNAGYTFISADDVIEILHCGKPVPAGAVWLSFDDGWRELLSDVLPVTQPWKIPITLFIPSGIVDGNGLFPWLHDPTHPSFSQHQARRERCIPCGNREAITDAELAELAAYPEVTIGSHSVSHSLLPRCTDEEVRFEIGECKRRLQQLTNQPIKCFAYPEGVFDGREKQFLIEFSYGIAVTTENAFISAESDPYSLPRFSVADDVTFPEAVCNMVGVWRPTVDPIKLLAGTAMQLLETTRMWVRNRIRPALGGPGL